MQVQSLTLLAAALCCSTTAAFATEYGQVVSSTPVYSSAPTAQRQCRDEVVETARRSSSGGGALVGALFGAALGNSLGKGTGRAVATGIGMVAGAAIGDQIEAHESGRSTATVQRCRNVAHAEQQIVGYDVVYDYQGVRRSARMAQDPGERIALEVVPAGAVTRGVERGAPAAPVYREPSYREPQYREPSSRAPTYRSPADLPYEDDDDAVQPRVRYAPRAVAYLPSPVVYINPLRAVYIGGGYDGGGHRHPGWRGHRHGR